LPGNYDLGCSSMFVACTTGGDAIMMQCPAETSFDVVANHCLGAAYVVACGGSSTTTAQPTVTVMGRSILLD
jgi:hypothetical protein